jgi:hypothetical protein
MAPCPDTSHYLVPTWIDGDRREINSHYTPSISERKKFTEQREVMKKYALNWET